MFGRLSHNRTIPVHGCLVGLSKSERVSAHKIMLWLFNRNQSWISAHTAPESQFNENEEREREKDPRKWKWWWRRSSSSSRRIFRKIITIIISSDETRTWTDKTKLYMFCAQAHKPQHTESHSLSIFRSQREDFNWTFRLRPNGRAWVCRCNANIFAHWILDERRFVRWPFFPNKTNKIHSYCFLCTQHYKSVYCFVGKLKRNVRFVLLLGLSGDALKLTESLSTSFSISFCVLGSSLTLRNCALLHIPRAHNIRVQKFLSTNQYI